MKSSLILSLFLLIIDFSYPIEAISEELTYRLPNNTKPVNYEIFLTFENFGADELTFEGQELIRIKVIERSNVIKIHSAVSVSEVALVNENNLNNPLLIDWIESEDDRDFLTISMENDYLEENSIYILIISFQGKINSANEGVFRGSYLDENNEMKFYIATQMQPTFARKVFPCYDEPNFKSTFTLSLTHSTEYTSIANMDLASPQIIENNQVTRTFKKTTLMSTYIFGFIIFDFEKKEINHNEIIYRIFSRSIQKENTNFGLDTATKSLELFENHFNVKYTSDKLDQVVLPQFTERAMENNFMIFYRDDLFLYEENFTTVVNKENAASIIVNKICHQFIGNQLTPQWWSVLWISEGFCSFYQYYLTNEIYPEMRSNELFAVKILQDALNKDSSNATPVTFYVENPAEIQSMFNSISYNKAASIIRMFYHTFTKEIFEKAIHIYLSKETSNEDGIAEPSHFYSALQQAAEDNFLYIAGIFQSWELQASYPVLHVERSYNDQRIRFTQNMFDDDGEKDDLWHIPITYTSKLNPTNSTTPQLWLNKERQREITISGLRPSHYFIVNVDQVGYYRVMYDSGNWMLIANELKSGDFNDISPNTRAMLIDDANAFVKHGMLDFRILLELMRYLINEIDYIPWISAEKSINYLKDMLYNENDNFKKFIQILTAKAFETYGVEENSNEHHEKHMRNIAINLACQAHLPECLHKTREIFDQSVNELDFKFPVDHKETLMCNGVINGTEDDFDYLWRLYDETKDSQILRAIGCIENFDILKNFTLKYDQVESLHWLTVIQSAGKNWRYGRSVVMEFLNEESENFKNFINESNDIPALNSIFEDLANKITTNELYDEFQQLMINYEISEVMQDSLKKIVETNLKWIELNGPKFQDFFKEHFNGGEKVFASWMMLLSSSIQVINADYTCDSFDSTFCYVLNQTISANESFAIIKDFSIDTTGIIIMDGNMSVLPNTIFTTYPSVVLFSTSNTSLTKLSANNFANGGKLINILITDGQVQSLENATFKSCKNLQSFFLTQQKISFIDTNAFKGLINLLKLSLNSNEISYLNPLIFEPLVKMIVFNAGKNRLSSLDPNLFVKNLKLVGIYFNYNDLTEIPSGLFAAQNLSTGTVDFSYNKLTTAQSFGANYVDMTFNRLKRFQFASGGSKHAAIRIENNLIAKVTCLSADLTVKSLYVANNSLLKLMCIRGMTRLTILDVSNNGLLKPTQKTFAKLTNLMLLMMYNMTKFSSFPARALVPMKNSLTNLEIDRLNSFKNIKQLLPNLDVLRLNTVTWNCTYLKFVRDLLEAQQIKMVNMQHYDANRCNDV